MMFSTLLNNLSYIFLKILSFLADYWFIIFFIIFIPYFVYSLIKKDYDNINLIDIDKYKKDTSPKKYASEGFALGVVISITSTIFGLIIGYYKQIYMRFIEWYIPIIFFSAPAIFAIAGLIYGIRKERLGSGTNAFSVKRNSKQD